MNTYLAIALVALTTALAAGDAMAQARLPAYTGGAVTPKVAPVAPLLPPSAALKRAMGQVPGAQALSVRPKGSAYIVKLKKGGNIIQLNVNSATGAITRLP